MRVLFIRSSERFSGAERYNIELIRKLRMDSSIKTGFLTNQKTFAEMLKIPVTPWLPEEVGTKRQLVKTILYIPIFVYKYIVSLQNYDAACFQSRTEMIFLTPILRILGWRIVWIQHGPFFVSEASRIIKVMYIVASRFATKIVAVSEDTKKDLIHGFLQKDKVVVIYIGISLPKMLKTPHKRFTVGFLGTVTKEKGIEDFIRATKNFYTLVIGDGPDRNLIQGEITGFVKNVKKYLSRIDVLLIPSHHHEGISMAILEGMSMGIPVFATDIGGNREIISNGHNGYLYKQGDTENMAHDIRVLSHNRSKLKLFGKRARKTIEEKFSINIQAKKFVSFFKHL